MEGGRRLKLLFERGAPLLGERSAPLQCPPVHQPTIQPTNQWVASQAIHEEEDRFNLHPSTIGGYWNSLKNRKGEIKQRVLLTTVDTRERERSSDMIDHWLYELEYWLIWFRVKQRAENRNTWEHLNEDEKQCLTASMITWSPQMAGSSRWRMFLLPQEVDKCDQVRHVGHKDIDSIRALHESERVRVRELGPVFDPRQLQNCELPMHLSRCNNISTNIIPLI